MNIPRQATYVGRALARGGQRSVLAVFCVAVGVLAIVALQIVGNAVDAGLTRNIRAINGGDLAVASPLQPLTPAQLGLFDTLRARGVLTAYTAGYGSPGQATGAHGAVLIAIAAVDAAHYPLAGPLRFLAPPGGTLARLLTGRNVVVSAGLAQALGAQLGDSFTVAAQDGRGGAVTIAGILDRGEQIFPTPLLLIAFASYQAWPNPAGRPLGYNLIAADVPGHSDAGAAVARAQIVGQLPLVSVTTAQGALAQNQATVANLRLFFQTAGLLALLIGGTGVINTLQVLLRRRTAEIAILKTVGYRRRDLYLLFGLEAGAIGLAGGLLGAAAGVGVSFAMQALVEQALGIALPVDLDLRPALAGLGLGVVAALVFGLTPIVQAAAVRPLVLLRAADESVPGRRGGAAGLHALAGALFFGLALALLRDLVATVILAAGTLVSLGVLRGGFTVVLRAAAAVPVQGRPRVYLAAMSLLVLAGMGVALVVPALGVLLGLLGALGLAVLVLPRRARATTLLALRNLGRQRARTVTTAVALFAGVFTLGLLLVLGQTAHATIAALLTQGPTNAAVVAHAADQAAVEAALARTAGIQHRELNLTTPDTLVAVNGQPMAALIGGLTASRQFNMGDVLRRLGQFSSVQGYDLAHGGLPDAAAVGFDASPGGRPATGYGRPAGVIAPTGRLLGPEDAGSLNVLIAGEAQTQSAAGSRDTALNYFPGDTITVQSQVDGRTLTLHVVGIYYVDDAKEHLFGSILADNSVVSALSGGRPGYAYGLRLDERAREAALQQIRAAVPGVETYSFVDLFAQINAVLDNLLIALEAVAGLALLAAVVIMANAVALAMLERRRELGILKAVGYSSSGVLYTVLVEQGVLGGLSAIPALAAVTVLMTLPGLGFAGRADTVSAPVVLGLTGGTIALCLLIGLGLAWAPTRRRPLDVLRYE